MLYKFVKKKTCKVLPLYVFVVLEWWCRFYEYVTIMWIKVVKKNTNKSSQQNDWEHSFKGPWKNEVL